jgi:hypothetical protein
VERNFNCFQECILWNTNNDYIHRK